ASKAWASFRQPDPHSWAALLENSIEQLPYLTSAILRMLEELPDVKNGLSRSEEQILRHLSQKENTPVELFRACQSKEEAKFMGDGTFFNLLENLAGSKIPLIQGLGTSSFWSAVTQKDPQKYFSASVSLTEAGQATLGGMFDHAVKNNINRCWGGTHLKAGNIWRWDRAKRKLEGG
ncbi:MAG: hypothetical protein OQK35_01805, partial [Alphaproteobacteria bacterium]|nr:hypothetical protein [Alphaproteobacteria bacterium]